MNRAMDTSLDVVKETGATYNPVFLKILEDIRGGGTIKTNRFPADVTEVKMGTLLQEDATTAGLYNIIKSAEYPATQASSNKIFLTPGHMFKAADYIAVVGKTSAATITSVTHTSATTDTLVLGTSIGTLATASIVNEVAAAGATSKLYTADSILKDTLTVRGCDLVTLNNIGGGLVIRGSVNESLLPNPVETVDKTALTDRVYFQ